MGVNIGDIKMRRANRDKEDKSRVPDNYYTEAHHANAREHMVTRDEAWDKANPRSEFMRHDGSVDIDAYLGKVGKITDGADKGKFLGLGKDGKLDGRELGEVLDRISKEYQIVIPEDIRKSLQQMSHDGDVKIDIKESIDNARVALSKLDNNHDGGVSAKELNQASDRNIER